jgi:hypothetical protein
MTDYLSVVPSSSLYSLLVPELRNLTATDFLCMLKKNTVFQREPELPPEQ